MKRSGFSMIELVFVIVILGVLAAVAVPRFVTTRTDAQVATLRSDIATVLKAVPAAIFAYNLDPTQDSQRPPSNIVNDQNQQYSNWGLWMMAQGGLDAGRWSVMSAGKPSGFSGKTLNPTRDAALTPVTRGTNTNTGSNTGASNCGTPVFMANGTETSNTGTTRDVSYLVFDPSMLPSNTSQGSGQTKSALCQGLSDSYPSGSQRLIPLTTTGKIVY